MFRIVCPMSEHDHPGVEPDEFYMEPEQKLPVKRFDVVVAGGGHSAVILPWALHSEAVVEPILTLEGEAAETIEDFRRS